MAGVRNKINSQLELIFSVSTDVEYNSGLDPTPNPPLPPNIEDDMQKERID